MTKTNSSKPALLGVVPLSSELEALKDALTQQGLSLQACQIGRRKGYHVPELHLWLFNGGLGKVEFALTCQTLLLQQSGFTGLLSLGCAGGLDPSLKLGDLVVADKIVEHDFKSSRPVDQRPEFPCEVAILPTPPNGLKLRIGPIASGDEDVLGPDRIQRLFTETKALAVAWEGAGAARACRRLKTPHLEIRVISDHGDPQNIQSLKARLPQLMTPLAQLLKECLS